MSTAALPLYKVLVDGRSAHGGTLAWSLPVLGEDGEYSPGAWHEASGPIAICRNGLHLTTDVTRWLKAGCAAYLAEGRGDSESDGDKRVFAGARLLRPAPEVIPEWWRGFTAFLRDEVRAMPWFQPDRNPDPAWRLFLAPSLNAAWDAAWAAASAAARDGAWAAAWDGAWAAAWAAARAAARDAAGDAASAAARNAAWAAAGAAAGDAAWAAAGDAQLYAWTAYVCDGLPLSEMHRAHSRARWDVWRKGYALLCDLDGVLYVYAKGGEG